MTDLDMPSDTKAMKNYPDERTVRRGDSVAAYFLTTALHHLQSEPHRAEHILRDSGIDPSWLNDPLSRIPADLVTRFWLSLTQELDDEFFAFDSRGMPRGSFALICRSAIHEGNLGRALRQCLCAFNLLLQDIHARLEIRGSRAAIVLETRIGNPTIRGVAEEIYLSMIIGFLCWLVGRRINIDRTQFGHPEPPHKAEHLLWGPWINFDAEHTEVEFGASLLSLPVKRTFSDLKKFLTHAPEGVVIRFRNRSGLAAKVYKALKAAPEFEWHSQSEMANVIGLNESAFRRQLEREGFTYQVVKHEVRRVMAFEYLKDESLSISEIAIRCGFREPSAFHRSFRQWTGMTPGRYRAWNGDKPA